MPKRRISRIKGKIKSKVHNILLPPRSFGGEKFQMVGFVERKGKARVLAETHRAKGYKVRVVYDPISRGEGKPTLAWERLWKAGQHPTKTGDFPGWRIYARRGKRA